MPKKPKPFKHFIINGYDYCWGRKVAVYINRNKKWLKIGIWCNRCGAIQIDPKFEKGLPRN